MVEANLPLARQQKVTSMENSVADVVDHYDWNSPLFVLGSLRESTDYYAMIILNAPIAHPPSRLFDTLWKSARYRVCADGGANRLLLANTRHPSTSQATDHHNNHDNKHYIPDLITGDLDSLTETTKNFFQSHNVAIERVVDQDRNDLDKAIAAVFAYSHNNTNNQPIRCIVVYGAFGGRFDQEMASMQALYKYPNLDLYLYDDHTMAFLLKPERTNRIRLALPSSSKNSAVGEGPVCGLIPLGSPVESVTTTGLQWNLDHQPTRFGDLVSTSNRILENDRNGATLDAAVVTVKASHPLVFTAQVHSGNNNVWSE
jgi:thiamine pyrophosphokinase